MSSTVFTVSAKIKHTATVIFLHGLGDTGYGWSLILERIRSPHIKYVCPTANVMPVSLNAGARMPSWFDLHYTTHNRIHADESGMKEAQKLVHRMVEEEVSQGIDSRRIILGGFSQGGGLALLSALTLKQQLAGIVALSVALSQSIPQLPQFNLDTPILQCHGDCDAMVPYKLGTEVSRLLKSFCTNHEFKTYNGLGHSTCDEEMEEVKAFIEKHLPPINSNL